jgi:hypothetical protein
MSQPETPPAPVKPPLPALISLRKPLSELPLPAEAVEDVEFCVRRGSSRRGVEEDLKLQFYFGGWEVGTLRENGGRTVVALVRPDSPTFGNVLDHLTPEERKRVCFYYVDRVDEELEPLPPPIDV